MNEINVKAPRATIDASSSLLVVDIGKKQKKKDIKRLRKGEGKLTAKIHDLIEQLREDNAISADAQPVVIVVREKAKRAKLFAGV
jgi:hypothetical protein